MQRAQQNYSPVFALLLLILTGPSGVQAAGIADRGAPDPILQAQPGTCDPHLEAADVTPGVDVRGDPVAAADLASGKVVVPGQLAVPLRGRPGRDAAYVAVDGARLDPLLNPPPACR